MLHEPLRYTHDEGHTDVCFSSDGSKFITCGTDGDIRVWSIEDGSDPTHNCIGDWSLCVRQKDDNLYVATGNNEVQILTFPEGERNGVLDRFVAPINHIAISKDSEHIALAGEDMEVKLFNLETKENQVFDGSKGPCLSVAVTSQFVAASSGDGKLRIWDIVTKEMVKETDCFPKVNSFANADLLCRIDFSPDGNYLAYPDKETVVVLDTLDWSQKYVLKCQDVSNHYSIVQYSPCGEYLVATTIKGDFVIFQASREVVRGTSKHPNFTTVCGLMWNPTGNGQIVYTDTQGQLGIISGCTTETSASKQHDDDLFSDNPVEFGDVQFESDDEDNENAISVEKLKREVMGGSELEPELNFEGSSAAPTPRPKTPEIPLQEPFMPSSTPEHLNPRYLCWNEVGIVRCYGSSMDEDSGKSIETEFHNATFHNSMMLQNYQDYVMGSVSTAALAVANAKQLYVIPLSASSKEWVLKLEDSLEEIVLIATSENLICFGTSNYLIRICSIYGTQRGVVSIPGPLVTMASYQNSLLVAYHSGSIRKGDQCISIKLIAFNGLTVESRDINSALGPEATLSWLGFTDMGTPAMMDSLGMLSLYPTNSNLWIPFCDTTKHIKNACDGFFLTSVIESQQTFYGIKCRASAYPSFTPTPTISELTLEPPFAEPTTDKTELEMKLFAWSNLQMNEFDKKFSETGLKAFALACKNNLDQRALELMEILSNPQLVNLSTKYALKMQKKLLASKLMELAAKLVGDDEDQLGFSSRVTAPPMSTMSNRKFTLSSIKRTPKNRQISKEPEVGKLEEVPPTPEVIPDSQEASVSSLNITTGTDESFHQEPPKNPFFKNVKKSEDSPSNPLSLINKYAGVDYVDAKENKMKNGDAEKRKQPDSSETVKQREKQRKLDRFMFSKRT